MLRTMFRTMLAVIFCTSLVFAKDQAQDTTGATFAAAGCGPSKIQFDVKADKNQHPLPQPEPGKAMVYVYEDDSGACGGGGCTARVGLDGAWVGANKGRSYFFFSVTPGDHRVCSAWQSSIKELSQTGAALPLTVEAGKVYYIRTTLTDKPSLKLKLIGGLNGPMQILPLAYSTLEAKNQPPVYQPANPE
ncbi:MAG TPA: DUF2846 domain-containing protein [Candidatus Angelobacter sp.]|nr:DUF2846 domain-containing protein [Candidatus Angelobacter sp.]